MTARRLGHALQGEPGRALLPRHLAPAEGPRQVGVALGTVGQHQQVVTAGVGGACLETAEVPCLEPAGERASLRVSSAPNTVGTPTALAASAKRTTP